MQPLIYKQRIQRWGFRKSMFTSLSFHALILFGISFVVIQKPWHFQEETIVNIKFANSAFDIYGESPKGDEIFIPSSGLGALENQDVSSQNQTQFSVRRLESNSTLESFETIYLNAWQRKVETVGYYEIMGSRTIKENFRVQIKSIIGSDGNLLSADVLQSSGNILLDQLAIKILKASSPFPPFPLDMLSRYQQLEIVRDWNFTSS